MARIPHPYLPSTLNAQTLMAYASFYNAEIAAQKNTTACTKEISSLVTGTLAVGDVDLGCGSGSRCLTLLARFMHALATLVLFLIPILRLPVLQ